MSLDISSILRGWDFDPNGVSVRIIQGEDGLASNRAAIAYAARYNAVIRDLAG